MSLKLLQIGLGRWGQNHARTWRTLGVDLHVCDADARLIEAAEPDPARRATRYEDLLDRVGAVDVVTPAHTHWEIVRRCLAAGKDVLCEKPLASTSAAAYELAEEAEATGRILQVGHIFRFEPAMEAVRQVLRSGRIGRVRYILGHFLGFKRPRADGGVAISDAIHLVDLVSWLLQRQPRKVTAFLRDYFGRGLDDTALISLDYGYEVAHVEAGYFPPERKRDLQIMGADGAIVCDLLAPASDRVRIYGHAHARQGTEWTAVEGDIERIAVTDAEPLRLELEAFRDSVATRAPPLVDGFAGAHAVAAIEAAVRSSREERAVAPDLRLPAYAR